MKGVKNVRFSTPSTRLPLLTCFENGECQPGARFLLFPIHIDFDFSICAVEVKPSDVRQQRMLFCVQILLDRWFDYLMWVRVLLCFMFLCRNVSLFIDAFGFSFAQDFNVCEAWHGTVVVNEPPPSPAYSISVLLDLHTLLRALPKKTRLASVFSLLLSP